MQPRSSGKFGTRLAFYYACLFVILGIQLPFFPLWLEARGLDPQAIGIVLATPIAVRIFAVPLLNRAADRAGDLRFGLIAASFAGTVGFVVVGFAHGFALILLTVALASLVSAPLMSLADAYALKGLSILGRAYGPVRLWGSAAFIVANVGAGLLLAVVSADDLIWMIAAAYVLLSGAALLLRPLASAPAATSTEPIKSQHWLSPNFLLLAAAASLIQASHVLYNGFSALDWSAKGMSTTTIGALWGLGVAAEIALFAVSGRMPLQPAALIAIGAAGAAIRWFAMTFNPSLPLLALLQCLHALSFGATHLGSVQLIARAAGERQASAQGDFATILAVSSVAATSVSGLLYHALGDDAYALMGALAVAGGACIVLARPARAGI